LIEIFHISMTSTHVSNQINPVTALHFPSRFALLVRAWRIQHTSGAVIQALGVTKDRLAKFASGEAVRVKEESGRRMTEALGKHLEASGVLAEHGLTRVEFIERFSDPDDLKFALFVVTNHGWPIPASVQFSPRQNVEWLAGRLTGKCLLYRLGVERRRVRGSVPDTTVETKVPVLRRIPVLIEDRGDNYLSYKDSYGMYGASYEPATASGFVFYTKSHICIFAEDVDVRKQSDLFMIQLRDRLIDAHDQENHLREGIVLMNGDLDTPTASKVIIRRLPEALQGLTWEGFIKTGEMKLDLHLDTAGNYVPENNADSELLDARPLGTKKYSWYTNLLQIRDYKIDISLDDGL
jgi:hypothetical protein